MSSSINLNNPEEGLSLFCPCDAAIRLSEISQSQATSELASHEAFQSKLSSLLIILMGEKRLAGLGYPTLGASCILEKVLRLTGIPITCEDDLCTDNCKKVNILAS